MSIPKYFEMNKPFLLCIKDGKKYTKKQVQAYIKKFFKLSDEDLLELLPSGRQTTFSNRVGWASTYLKKAGLITSPERAVFQITDEGKKVLKENPAVIDEGYLSKYQSFQQFITGESSSKTEENETPDDTLESSFQKINESLADELLSEIMKISPVSFEQMVLDLMAKMGYGTFANAAKMTSTSGDEGIDGIIMQDKLGFDLIYVQAKRWNEDHVVGRPEIQAFVGAISGRGGKGLFVTTSKFSKQAIDYAKTQHIILIDGKKLTELMIEYNFGVSVQKTFEIKVLDSDIFYKYIEE